MSLRRSPLVLLLAVSTLAYARGPKKTPTPEELPTPEAPTTTPEVVTPPPPPPPSPWEQATLDAAQGDFNGVRALAPERAASTDPVVSAEAKRRLDAADDARCEATPVVGLLLPFTGKYEKVAISVQEAVRAAYLHAGGTDADVRLRAIASDGSPESAVAGLTLAAADPCLIGVVGPLRTDDATPVAAEAQRLGVPLVSLSAGHVANAEQPWVFSAGYTLHEQVLDLAAHAKVEAWDEVALYAPDSPYGRTVATKLTEALLANGVHVVVDQRYTSNSREAQTRQLDALVASITAWKSPTTTPPGTPARALDAILVPDDAKIVAYVAAQLSAKLPEVGATVPLAGLASWNKNELLQPWTPGLTRARFTDIAPAHPPMPPPPPPVDPNAPAQAPTAPPPPPPPPELLWAPPEAIATTDAAFFTALSRHPTALELTAWDAGLLVASTLRADVRARWQWAEALQGATLDGSPTGWHGFEPVGRTAQRVRGIWYASPTGFSPNP